LSKDAVAHRDFAAIGALARKFVEAARVARAR
jgi:hypothetical protein